MQDIYQKLSKDYLIDELVEGLIHVPSEEIVKFLSVLDINFPRSLRFSSLKKVLYPILTEEYDQLLKSESDVDGPERLEESRRQTRLTWIDSFSETQLENELYKFNNRDYDQEYLTEFWKRFINFLITEGIPKKDIAEFIEKALHKYESNQSLPPVRLFNKTLEPFIYDEEDTFDGLLRDIFAQRVVLSATISEIKQIGAKFNIKVPTRLTKIQVLAIIVDELKKRGEYIPEVHEELNDFNLKELEDFARLNNIIAFAYINKDQMIEYMYKEYDANHEPMKKFIHDEETAIELEKEIEELENQTIEETPEETQDEEEVVEEAKEEPIVEEEVEETPVVIKEVEEEKVETVETVVYKNESINEIKQEILSLKELVLELQTNVSSLSNELSESKDKLDQISKGLIPRWVKRLILVLFIIGLFFMVFIPLSYYLPEAPIIKQINYLFNLIPFFGGRTFLEFLHKFFMRIFGIVV